VTLNGTPGTSTTATLSFSEPNGTYPFVTAAVGYKASPSSGNVTVDGAQAYVAVTFSKVGVTTYYVTFTETGLATGTTWYVTLNGTPESSTNTTVIFSEPNGVYAFSVSNVTGYNQTTSSKGTVTVNGGPQGVSVSFSTGQVTSTSPSSGSSLWVYVLVAVVIIVVVAGVVLMVRRRQPPSQSTSSPPSPGTPGGPQ